MFSILKKKISASAKHLSETLRGEVTIDENKLDELLFELEIALIEADVAMEVVEKLRNELKEALVGKTFDRGDDLSKIVRDELMKSLKSVFTDSRLLSVIQNGERPFVMAFIGVNGTGKTTTIAKLSHLLEKKGLTTVIAACDTYRAGAIDQIEKHADNLGVKLIKHGMGADSAAVAFDAIEHARAKGIDVVLIDTAGRMNTNINLMDELKKVIRISKPHQVIFVGDALSGNAVVDQVTTFNNFTPIDGAILTKADADAKGGSAISVSYILKKPIYYLGVGQEYDDLKEFNSDWFLSQIF